MRTIAQSHSDGDNGPARYLGVEMDNCVRPNSWISYSSADKMPGDGGFGMVCREPRFSDYVSCRRALIW